MQPIIEALLARSCRTEAGNDPTINPFWIGQLQKFRDLVSRGLEQITLEDLQSALGYTSTPLPPNIKKNLDIPATSKAFHYISKGLKHNLRRFVEDLPVDKKDKSAIEHFTILAVLGRTGMLEEYMKFVDEIHLESSMTLARHYYYVRKLEQFLDIANMKSGINALEIGAGSGIFASFTVRRISVMNYIIVDLPEMLMNSVITLANAFPDASFHLNESLSRDNDSGLPAFWFFETTEISKISDRSVDVALNFNSFMEMDYRTRDFYFDEIYRVGAEGALFYNVNRRQGKMTTREGQPYDNNPLLYPYRPSDIVLEWEPDEVQQSYRSRFASSPQISFCISRAGRINPPTS